MDIQVGDIVTFKSIEEPDEEARDYVVKDENFLADILVYKMKNEIEILDVKRPIYKSVPME